MGPVYIGQKPPYIQIGIIDMIKLYSKGCEYAIRALMHIEDGEGSQRFQAKDVCEKAKIPEAFTRKVFQALVQGGFLKALRGPGGGYVLTKKPEDITLLEIINAVDGITNYNNCVMGLEECNLENPCPLHDLWATTKAQLVERLESKTLRHLLDTTHRCSESE